MHSAPPALPAALCRNRDGWLSNGCVEQRRALAGECEGRLPPTAGTREVRAAAAGLRAEPAAAAGGNKAEGAEEMVRVATGGKVTFTPPCFFCIENY